MNETSKLNSYRLEKGYDKYFKGRGIDIGCGSDMLSPLVFPTISAIIPYDIEDGDAQLLENVEDNSLDFCFSSHCLEHMRDPAMALSNWIRVCKTGGYLVIAVPDFVFYEKMRETSLYNSDHKHTFSLERMQRIIPNSKCICIYDLLRLYKNIEIISVELLIQMDMSRFSQDQTLEKDGIAQIEIILKKI